MLIRRKKQDNGMFKWKNTENGMPREKTVNGNRKQDVFVYSIMIKYY